ncbi:MAG: 2-dehydropantoate 2-reductase N-terminal domain-containing protein [Gammaproteobacteria bacterium]|nr:2-dehydropantoate 2-reductase N-terminal domain-containing protein [Gammaproteobacteria bacterium]
MAESDSPTFAIMGSGGMGGYIGAKLSQAGYRVSFIARGAHLEAMQNNGLKIEGPDETFVIDPIRATGDPKDIGPVDFVIFCVKLWDTEAAGDQCRDLIGPDTAVLSMQNGVDAEPILSGILGLNMSWERLQKLAPTSSSLDSSGVLHPLQSYDSESLINFVLHVRFNFLKLLLLPDSELNMSIISA